MVSTHEIIAPDGRALRVYDSGNPEIDGGTVLIWHHGTPQHGKTPVPLLSALADRRIRCVSYSRPGYDGSMPQQGRNVATAAADVATIANVLEIEKFATMGISSGGPHALACAALLPGRVTRVVTVAAPAPFAADGLDWFAGMGPAATARMRAGNRGRSAIQDHLGTVGFASDIPTISDLGALVDEWEWLADVSQQAMSTGFPGAVDDVLAMIAPWGFSLSQVNVPVLVVHGVDDRIVPIAHADWLARHIDGAELWLRPRDGHVAVLNSCTAALDWLIGSDH